MTTKDFIYCEDCKMFVDFFKFDNIKDTGHENCNHRFVTEEELKELVKECEENGCINCEPEKFAEVYWSVEDIIHEAELLNITLSEEEAKQFLYDYGTKIADGMTAEGWHIIRTFLTERR